MKPSSLVFGHQREVVRDFAKLIPEIDVVTGEADIDSPLPGVRISDTQWMPGKHLSNISSFMRRTVPLLLLSKIKSRRTVIFSYMTEVQSALIAPLARFLGIPHFLWYAHTSKSIYLRWCHFWVTVIVTSTKDSCPYDDKKVKIIGQSIDENLFCFLPSPKLEFYNGVYVGRFDKSKNLEDIIALLNEETLRHLPFTLTLVGEPTPGNEKYIEALIFKHSNLVRTGRLKVLGRVANRELPNFLRSFDFFVNAFTGSLDKSLIEATLMGIPVVTVNPPYISQFGTWSGDICTDELVIQLSRELLALISASPKHTETELKIRSEWASKNHARNQWLTKLYNLFTEA